MENCHFLDHPPTPISLRNIKMAPNYKSIEIIKKISGGPDILEIVGAD
jgi:hypothetical protein